MGTCIIVEWGMQLTEPTMIRLCLSSLLIYSVSTRVCSAVYVVRAHLEHCAHRCPIAVHF